MVDERDARERVCDAGLLGNLRRLPHPHMPSVFGPDHEPPPAPPLQRPPEPVGGSGVVGQPIPPVLPPPETVTVDDPARKPTVVEQSNANRWITEELP